MTDQPSGKLYTAVTKYWPRIAVGLVATVAVAGWVIEGLTADTGIEFYLMAWGATTGGLWFMFEKAEKSLGDESREKVAGWLSRDTRSGIASMPKQFILLFDGVFGERHWSLQCFRRSSIASVLAATLVALILVPGIADQGAGRLVFPSGDSVLILILLLSVSGAMIVNLVPDYFSLLQTRWAIRLADRRGSLLLPVVVDWIATALIASVSLVVWIGGYFAVAGSSPADPAVAFGLVTMLATAFFSTFLTSVWLWLYVASVLASRLLLRMNNGVGFLLRVTDVEKQPFRSMGFVSVIIVSALFALGLPLVLL